MMKGVVGKQISYMTLIGVHEIHIATVCVCTVDVFLCAHIFI